MIVAFARQLETQQYKPALVLIETLLTELRRLDDKMILTEVHLLESRVYRGIGNLAKSKVCVSHVMPPTRIPKESSFSPR
jgi:26S proteasome regulatory subunit N6